MLSKVRRQRQLQRARQPCTLFTMNSLCSRVFGFTCVSETTLFLLASGINNDYNQFHSHHTFPKKCCRTTPPIRHNNPPSLSLTLQLFHLVDIIMSQGSKDNHPSPSQLTQPLPASQQLPQQALPQSSPPAHQASELSIQTHPTPAQTVPTQPQTSPQKSSCQVAEPKGQQGIPPESDYIPASFEEKASPENLHKEETGDKERELTQAGGEDISPVQQQDTGEASMNEQHNKVDNGEEDGPSRQQPELSEEDDVKFEGDLPEDALDETKTEQSLITQRYEQIPVQQFGEDEVFRSAMAKKDAPEEHYFYGVEYEGCGQAKESAVEHSALLQPISQPTQTSEALISQADVSVNRVENAETQAELDNGGQKGQSGGIVAQPVDQSSRININTQQCTILLSAGSQLISNEPAAIPLDSVQQNRARQGGQTHKPGAPEKLDCQSAETANAIKMSEAATDLKLSSRKDEPTVTLNDNAGQRAQNWPKQPIPDRQQGSSQPQRELQPEPAAQPARKAPGALLYAESANSEMGRAKKQTAGQANAPKATQEDNLRARAVSQESKTQCNIPIQGQKLERSSFITRRERGHEDTAHNIQQGAQEPKHDSPKQKPKKKTKKGQHSQKKKPQQPLTAQQAPPTNQSPPNRPPPTPQEHRPDNPEPKKNQTQARTQQELSTSLVPPHPEIKKEQLPLLTSQIIENEAFKQRMGSTFNVFQRYISNYRKALNFYKMIVQNVSVELNHRKQQKSHLLSLLTDYFEGYARLNLEFSSKTLGLQVPVLPNSRNPFGNIQLQLRRGFDDLLNLRKTVANEKNNFNTFILGKVLKELQQAFAIYFEKIASEERRQVQRKLEHFAREKAFFKVVSQVEKVFKKGINGKFKIDILSELARFVNDETTHRQFLKLYGKGLIPLRHTYIQAECELFHTLQVILNAFKAESKVLYSVGRRVYDYVEDLSKFVKQRTKFSEICPLTDIDYIRYVLQLQWKKQHRMFRTQHFESYLDLIFFDRLVGNIRDLYKGAICKVFPMNTPHEELIHTVSGNLVHFNRETDQCLNIFVIRNLNARIIGQCTVEFDELLRGLIFNENRTVRIKLKDSDRASELICYLDEKDDDFIVEQP